MASTSIRTAVKSALITLLEARSGLTGVQVLRSWGRDTEQEYIALGQTKGQMDLANIASGRLRRDDQFTIEVWIASDMPGMSDTEAETRCTALLAELENLLADNKTLGGVSGLQWAQLAGVDGPDPDPDPEGSGCTVRAEVLCHARLV